MIGAFANIVGNVSNANAIGANATAALSNTIQLGNIDVTAVNIYGNLFVKGGKGIIRSIDGTQQKKITVVVPAHATISKGQAASFNFFFRKALAAIRMYRQEILSPHPDITLKAS